MRSRLSTADRVILLLALVPYLQEHGPTTIEELSEAFDVEPELLRSLVRFLGTAGVPGETLQYQHEDLFDIDWDALELHDTVSLVHVVAVDDTPRFSSLETAALIAGLHSLAAVLPEEDAEAARSAAAKLGSGGARAVSVTSEPQDPRLPSLVSALRDRARLSFEYRDARGAVTRRSVDPLGLEQGAGVWYLRAHCLTRDAERFFRVDRMRDPRRSDERATAVAAEGPVAPVSRGTTATARVRERSLASLCDAAPRVVKRIDDEWVRVRVRLGHPHAAVALVQGSPGNVVIERPATAREAVRVWAEQALAAYDAG